MLNLLLIAGLTAVYFAAGKLGLSFAFIAPSTSAVWPPTGIALTAILLLGYRVWPGIFFGAFLANIFTAGTVLTSLGIGVGNTLEAIAGGFLVRQLAGGRNAFDRPLTIFRFAALAGLVSTALSASIGTTVITLGGISSWGMYGNVWLTWWLGDAVGNLVVAPLLILWFTTPFPAWDRKQTAELALLFLSLGAAGLALFGGLFHDALSNAPLEFLCLPFLVWVAYRFSQRETATAVFMLAVIAVWGTIHGFGPFARRSSHESLLLLQSFMGFTSVCTLALAAVSSERRKTEEVLSHLAAIVESSDDAIIGETLDGLIVSWNPGAVRMLGYSPEEVIGRPVSILNPPGHSDSSVVILNKIKHREEVEHYETVRRRKDGRHILVSLTISPIMDRTGRVVGASTIARDITQYRETEESLRNVGERFTGIYNASKDAIGYATLGGVLLDVNDAFCRLTGYSREQLLSGKTFKDITPPEYHRLESQKVGELLRTGTPTEYEKEYMRRDGSRVPVLVTSFIVRDADGKPAGLAGIIKDITEHKQAQETRDHLAAIVDSSEDAIIGETLDGIITSWNLGARKIYGYGAEEITGKHGSILLPTDRMDEMRNILEKLRLGEVFEHYETVRVRKDGKHIDVSLTISPIKDAAGKLVGVSTIARDVTERKLAEEALRASEERNRSIIATALDAFIGMDAAGRITDWNKRAETTFGWTSQEVLGKVLADTIIPPAMREAHKKGLENFLATGKGPILGKHLELSALHRDGHEFPVELMVWPLRREGALHFNAFLRDVTERKQAQEVREYIAAIVDSSEDAIVGKTLDGVITSWNAGAKKIYGYSAEEVIGKHISLLVPAEMKSEIAELMQKLRRGESCTSFETVRVRKDGKRIHVSLSLSPIKEPGGAIVGVSAIARDITRQKEEQEALRQSQRQYVELVQGAPDPIITLDQQGLVKTMNPAAEQAFGYRTEELANKKFVETGLLGASSKILVSGEIAKALTGHSGLPFEMEIIRSDGQKMTFEGKLRTIRRREEPDALEIILRDITLRKRMDQLKDEFISTVSHELRTPLSILLGSVQSMRKLVGGPLSEKQVKLIDIASRNGARLTKLVDDLLDLSRMEAGAVKMSRRPVDVAAVVAEILESFRLEAAQKNIALKNVIVAKLPRVDADPELFTRVLMNLLSNAVRFARQEVSVVADNARGGFVRISVIDDGPGLSQEEQKRLFNKFEQIRRPSGGGYKGTGLGLAICKEIVEQHGGRIWMDSELNQGSRFHFMLPVAKEANIAA